MDFNQIESFVNVVSEGSFTGAAKKSFISQPTISAHIQKLEEELGVGLMVRTTKSLELTPAGKAFYAKAVSLLDIRKQMESIGSDSRAVTLKIGASTVASAYILPKILPRFHRKNPEVLFSVHQSDSLDVLSGMKKDLYHVGVIGMECEDSDFECFPIAKDRMVLITPKNEKYLDYQEEKVTPLEILLESPVIAREEGSGSKKSAERYLKDLGIAQEKLNIVARVNDQQAIKNLVAGGLGVSVISDLAVDSNDDKLLIFPLSEKVSERQFYVVYRKGYGTVGNIQKLVSYIRSNVRKEFS